MTAGMVLMLSGSLGALLAPAAHAQDRATDTATPNTTTVPPADQAHKKAADDVVASANAEEMTVIGHHNMVAGAAANYNKKTANLGPLGTRRTLDTPMSIMTVPHDVIVNQQARNVNDLMQYIPSVQLETRADPGTSRPQSRGFEADVISNSRIDGLNAFTVTPYAAEQFDNIQVLNGLSGALYGPQNPAGTFEYGLKRPTDERINRLVVGVDSIGTLMENVDSSGRLGKHGWFGYRINLLHGDGTTYVQDSWVRRNMVSADFDIHFDRDTVLELDASHYTYDERGMPAGINLGNPGGGSDAYRLPEAPDLSKPHMGQSNAGFNSENNVFLAKLRHRINDDWSFVIGGLYQDSGRQVFESADTLINNNGGYKQSMAAATTVNDFKVGSNMAYINGHVRTGFIRHDLVIGTNGYMEGGYNPLSGQSYVSVPSGSLDNPVAVNGPQTYYKGKYESQYVRYQSMILGDTVHFNRHWSAMGTLAWSWLDQDSTSTVTAEAPTKQTVDGFVVTTTHLTKGKTTHAPPVDAAFSPMASLVYKPADNQTAYFTYGRSLQAGTSISTGAVNDNQYTSPVRSEEFEVGYKYMFRQMQFNIAGFRATRSYAYIDPTTLIYGNYGTQRNYGVEFQAMGHITPRLSVIGGMTWIDAEVLNTGNAKTSNKEAVGAAPLQANVLLDYRIPFATGFALNGLAVNANVHYTGRRAADVYNTTYAGSYVTLDMGVRYPFRAARHPWMARFGVTNVANERYWSSVYNGTYASSSATSTGTSAAYAGLPRAFHFTLEADF
ncbi:TonB-dependent siderophore receptor [Komagataeibacter sp. FNDCF1]|uniref:TonB-dependent receptor n=1 Tax=Komagataeibacter sp. FNDCF1 TaxID=2878681 RepID=UPI001E462E8D|nr:TonB-dependent receptor [Komagataeibacter sp. FNDCF1]MCE2565183.1 TonB-dependent receptor [Komagataeibacter sp. FNDCF1]